MKRTVGVIGGGAAGMMAAIQAAKLGADVTLIEHTNRIGKKILVTGNGKCNFTNSHVDADCYYGQHKSFALQIIEQFNVEETLHFFKEIGLLYRQRDGYFYPLSNQASSVLDVLRFTLQRYNVAVLTEQEPVEIKPASKGTFVVQCKSNSFRFDRIIMACGSKASPKTGSDGSGYQLAQKLGHHIIKPVPALVQLKSSENYFKSISGIRMQAKLSLIIDHCMKRTEQGELQITDYGISGIPVFQFSRLVSYALIEKKKVMVTVDCVPEMSIDAIKDYLIHRMRNNSELTMEDALQGFLNKKLNIQFLKLSGIKPNETARNISGAQIQKLCALVKSWDIPINGTNDFTQCQVCAGGVSTKELTSHCESVLHPGLFFAGEIIDIDGICGGYNLQWAWSSAVVAAREAMRQEK